MIHNIGAGTRLRLVWCYRRYNPEFTRWVWGPSAELFPVHELGSAELVLPALEAVAGEDDA